MGGLCGECACLCVACGCRPVEVAALITTTTSIYQALPVFQALCHVLYSLFLLWLYVLGHMYLYNNVNMYIYFIVSENIWQFILEES